MNTITFLYREILYRPLFNGLIFLYNVIPGHDFGIAIIVLTIIIRFILYPLSRKATQSQKALQDLQPKIKEIQQKYKDNRQAQGQALMEIYKIHKINPASGCLTMLVQLPILLALFSVFRNGLKPESLSALYGFVANPGLVNKFFLGLMDLSAKSLPLAILAGLAQFVQSKMLAPPSQGLTTDFASAMNKQMVYMFPILTVFIAAGLPAGLSLYWVAMTLFGIVQQYFTLKKNGERDTAKIN